MLEALITSKTRIKLLLKFFLNTQNTGYLRSLESEFGESTNAIRYELNKFTSAGLLTKRNVNNKKLYQANTNHPLFPEINRILRKYVGIDEIIDKVVLQIGELEAVYLLGNLAKGVESPVLEIWLIGQNIEKKYLKKLIKKTENIINRKIKYLIFAKSDFDHSDSIIKNKDALMLWKR